MLAINEQNFYQTSNCCGAWVEERDVYLWTVICQGCGAHEVEVLGSDAQVFEDWHNKSCKGEVVK
jgi:hypothetical protein